MALLIFVSFSATSCLLDDESMVETFDDGPNFASFSREKQNLSAVSNGEEYTFGVVLELQGPTLVDVSEDVVANIEVVASESTAIEGVHYYFESTTTTLKKSENYIATIPITVITDGIMAPLDENPILTLRITDVNGNNMIANSKKSVLTFVYQCFADLSGTYLVTNDWCPASTSFLTTIEPNPDGSWHIGSADGGWLEFCTGNTGLHNYGNITELCGDILPSTDLEYGTNGGYGIGDVLGGTWDAVNGVLTMDHKDIFFTGGPYEWTSTYTRQ